MADENVITSIAIEVNAKTDDAERKLTALKNTLQSLSQVKLSSTIAKRFGDLGDAMKKFQTVGRFSPVNAIGRIADAVKKLDGVKISKSITNRLIELSVATQEFKDVDTSKVLDVANAIKILSEAAGETGKIKFPKISGLQNMQKAMQAAATVGMPDVAKSSKAATTEASSAKVETMASKFKQFASSVVIATGKLDKFAVAAGTRVASALGKMAANLAVAPWKRLGSSIKNLVGRLTGFFAALKRIAIYRAIRAALKEITQGFKEGMQNLYQYSLLINGTFKDSMDSLATSALYLKNSLGAMVAPIVNALAPAVDYLVDKFVNLLNTFNELIATLTGASTWTKAIKYPTQYAEAAEGANGRAKELRATLLGFDEINRLDDNSKGARGSAADMLDYSKMFEEVAVSEAARGWAQKIREAFSGDGGSIGKLIAEGINDVFDNAYKFLNDTDWSGFGEWFADGLNGAIANINVKKIGGTIASTVNAAFKTLGGFFSKVDWKEFGKFISEGINGFFNDLNTAEIARTISSGISGALKMAASFLTNIDVEVIGQRIGELIKNIKWSSILSDLADVVVGAIKTAPKLKGVGFEIMNGIVSGIMDMIPQLPSVAIKILKGLAEGMADNMLIVITQAFKVVSSIGTAIKAAASYIKDRGWDIVDDICDGISDGIDNIKEWGGKIIKNFCQGVSDAWNKYGGWVKDLFEWMEEKIEWFSDILDFGSDSTPAKGKTRTKKQTVTEKVTSGIVGTLTDFVGDFTSDLTNALLGRTKWYANGGTPETGSLFFANEGGEPELVAQVGHKTQVANNDQIVRSIQAATENANAEGNMYLSEAVSLLRSIASKNTTVVAQITTDSITSGLDRQNRRGGRTIVPIGG